MQEAIQYKSNDTNLIHFYIMIKNNYFIFRALQYCSNNLFMHQLNLQ